MPLLFLRRDESQFSMMNIVFQCRFPVAPHLLVASENYPPHVTVTEFPNGTWVQTGAMINLLQMFASAMNFT